MNRNESKKPIELEGLGASGGIAIGRAYIIGSHSLSIPEYFLDDGDVESELSRFEDSIKISKKQLNKLKQKSKNLPEPAAEEVGYLLDAHLSMLQESRLIRSVRQTIQERQVNAEWAVRVSLDQLLEHFLAMEGPYVQTTAQEIREAGHRLVRNLTKTPYHALSHVPVGSILIAEDLTPADTALIHPNRIQGFALVFGGIEGHTAIMARSMNIPAVLGVTHLFDQVSTGDEVILDGQAGKIIVHPNPQQRQHYQSVQDQISLYRQSLVQFKSLPAQTMDHCRIGLQCNLELPWELDAMMESGAEGIGLLRTEFLYMNRPDLPGEDEQFEIYRDIVQKTNGLPVTIRTLDVGGEKLSANLSHLIGEPLNPALGLRAIRLSLHLKSLLMDQLRAIVRVSNVGPVRILLPMVSNVDEIHVVREALRYVGDELKERNVLDQPLPPLGIMVEIPGTALSADIMAPHVDFFAIGSNDLTMYTLAIDRADEQVAYLYNPAHPAVLRLIQFATSAARRNNIPISICGEIAGNPKYVPLLLGLGLRELSMVSGKIGTIKHWIRSIKLSDAEMHAQAIMQETDPKKISEMLEQHFRENQGKLLKVD